MMVKGFKQAFEEWWKYYFIKNLYGYTKEEMKQHSPYEEGPPFVELAKARMYKKIPNRPPTPESPIERGEEDGS